MSKRKKIKAEEKIRIARECIAGRLSQSEAEAQAWYKNQLNALVAEREAKQLTGYEEYAKYCLEHSGSPETEFYVLYDINGNGTQELIIDRREILSMAEGVSYLYFTPTDTNIPNRHFQLCENNVLEVYSDITSTHYYYFYKAGSNDVLFLEGVIHDTNEDIWYLTRDEGVKREQITAEKAQEIRDSYPPIDFDWLPLKKYGMDVASIHYTDPYARYIASKMEHYDNAANYEYALLDLNGDGIEELIARDVEVRTNEENYLLLSIHSIKDGELWNMGADYITFTYVCESGILEWTEDFVDDDSRSGSHSFYCCTENGVELIEKISRSSLTGYWYRALEGQESKIITKEEAMSVLASYKRIELDMKPFSAYPME